MVIVGQENPDDMCSCSLGTMAKARPDQGASEVAVHAVVGPPRDVAGISRGIDLQMDVAALRVRPALRRGKECKVALYDHTDRPFEVGAKFNCRAGLGPNDFERRTILRIGSRKGERRER